MKQIKLVDRYGESWFQIQANRWISDESWEKALSWAPTTCGLPRVEVEQRFAPLTEVEFEPADQ